MRINRGPTTKSKHAHGLLSTSQCEQLLIDEIEPPSVPKCFQCVAISNKSKLLNQSGSLTDWTNMIRIHWTNTS